MSASERPVTPPPRDMTFFRGWGAPGDVDIEDLSCGIYALVGMRGPMPFTSVMAIFNATEDAVRNASATDYWLTISDDGVISIKGA
ncbi:MAG: hypothetical protein WDN46_22990 [Methylocella sp.]